MESIKRKCKVINGEVWVDRCLRCNAPLEEKHGERLFCWNCWIKLNKKRGVTKEDMIQGYMHAIKYAKERNSFTVPQLMGIFDSNFYKNAYHESPITQVNYHERQGNILKKVIIFFKLSGNCFGIEEVPTQMLDFMIAQGESLPIEEQLPFKHAIDAKFNEFDAKDIVIK